MARSTLHPVMDASKICMQLQERISSLYEKIMSLEKTIDNLNDISTYVPDHVDMFIDNELFTNELLNENMVITPYDDNTFNKYVPRYANAIQDIHDNISKTSVELRQQYVILSLLNDACSKIIT